MRLRRPQVSTRGAVPGMPFPFDSTVHRCFTGRDVIGRDGFAGRQPISPLADLSGTVARSFPATVRPRTGIIGFAHPLSVRRQSVSGKDLPAFRKPIVL